MRTAALILAAALAVSTTACGSDAAPQPSASSAAPNEVLPATCEGWAQLNVGERYAAIHQYLNLRKIDKSRDRAQSSDTVAQAISEGCGEDPAQSPRDSADRISGSW